MQPTEVARSSRRRLFRLGDEGGLKVPVFKVTFFTDFYHGKSASKKTSFKGDYVWNLSIRIEESQIQGFFFGLP